MSGSRLQSCWNFDSSNLRSRELKFELAEKEKNMPKILIDIPASTKYYVDHKRDMNPIMDIIWEATRKGVVIPDYATNGEVIASMFPNIEIEYRDDVVDVYGLSSFSVTFKQNWWDAPYERKEK